MITNFECADSSADGLDNPNTFMSQNGTRLASGHVAFQNVQISSTYRSFSMLNNRIARLFNLGLWSFFEYLLPRAFCKQMLSW